MPERQAKRGVSRRSLLKRGLYLAAAAGGLFFSRTSSPTEDPEILIGRPQNSGVTFSQKQCEYLESQTNLGVDYKEVFDYLCSLKPQVIRLCAYWDEFERSPEKLDYLTQKARQENIPVILAVGAKAPRYKEFHLPDRIVEKFGHPEEGVFVQNDELNAEVLNYQRAVIEKYRDFSNIFAFQIENEPLNRLPITYNNGIEYKLLESEIRQARQLLVNGQKIMLTTAVYLWPPDPGEDLNFLNQSIALLRPDDMIGLNIYSRVPNGRNGYHEPVPKFWDKLKVFDQQIKAANLQTWIAESQAEPWEDGSPVHIQKRMYPSFNPERAVKLIYKLNYLGIDNILLWGFEHWYFHRKQGHMEWSDTLEPMIKKAA